MSVAQKLQKGIHAAQKGDMQRAAAFFEAALKIDPSSADALQLSGTVAHKLGKSDKAIKRLRRALEIDPANAHAHTNLGNVYKETGRDAEAVASYRKVLERNPFDAGCLNNMAVALRNTGAFEQSRQMLMDAIEIAPAMAELHYNLGRTLASMEQLTEAAGAFRVALDLSGDWADPLYVAKVLNASGASREAETMLVEYLERHPGNESVRYYLGALRGEAAERAPDSYVTATFNEFAATFDSALERLEYQGPARVEKAMAAVWPDPLRDKSILDLGCGTGLCGTLIAPYAHRLVGIDLSPEMLKRAELRGCYGALHVAELQEFLFSQQPKSIDGVICVETLIYLGELTRSFAGIKRVLRSGGIFIGTVEALKESANLPYRVDPTGRFKHKQSYVEKTVAASGLRIASVETATLRKERDVEVEGLIMTLIA